MQIYTLAYWSFYIGAYVTSFTRMKMYIAYNNYTEGRCSDPHKTFTLNSILTCSFYCFKDDSCVAFYLEDSLCLLYSISSLEFLETNTNVKCYIAETFNKENLGNMSPNTHKNDQKITHKPGSSVSYYYKYANKIDSQIKCPDGSVLSGLGYCADENAICEGICAILNEESDAMSENSYREEVTDCNFKDLTIAMEPFGLMLGKGYVKHCVTLQNGWNVDRTDLRVTPRTDPPTMAISGVRLSNPSEWLLCSEAASPRFAINNLYMGISFEIESIECFEIY